MVVLKRVVIALALLASCGVAFAQNAPPAGDVENGKKVYLAVGCFTCHGRSGQGGNFNYPAPVLAKTSLSAEMLTRIVRTGPNDMPAYPAAVLPDKEVADIRAFLRSLPGRKAVEEIPLLKQF
jgi:mono/diheme cytochrome c family protein